MLACNEVQKISDAIVRPSPREVYARGFGENDVIHKQWRDHFRSALHGGVHVSFPYREIASFPTAEFPVYSYVMNLKQGQKATVSIRSRSSSSGIFVDFFEFRGADILENDPLLAMKRTGDFTTELEVERSGRYKIIVQPEHGYSSQLQIEIFSRPTIGFPVAGNTGKAIQSYWGDPRSGGKRRHEGVDIFAPRSTPALAVADGRIAFTGDRGLGGKQVWLRDGTFGKSFYYAHLDSISVSGLQRVRKGDTIGFIGNTGNARTTPPHLHFGIYTGVGAIDPLPFIQNIDVVEGDITVPTSKGVIATITANIRSGPSADSERLNSLKVRDTVRILGSSDNWYHVMFGNGRQGFIYSSLVDPIIGDRAAAK